MFSYGVWSSMERESLYVEIRYNGGLFGEIRINGDKKAEVVIYRDIDEFICDYSEFMEIMDAAKKKLFNIEGLSG